MEGITKSNVSHKSLLMDVGVRFCRFLEAVGTAFLVFAAKQACKFMHFKSSVTDPKPGVC